MKGTQYISSTFQTLSSVDKVQKVDEIYCVPFINIFLGNLKFYYYSTLLQYIYFKLYIYNLVEKNRIYKN